MRPPSLRPSEPPPEEQGTLLTRAGTVMASGALAAALASLPAALRAPTVNVEVDRIGAWLALTGVAVLPCVALSGIFRGAYAGLRAFGGEGALARAAAVAAWLVLVFISLSGYGALLRATTHHHALAGTTFALGALALAIGAALAASRLGGMLRKAPEDAQKVLAVTAFVALFICIGVVASRLGHEEGAPVVDAMALLLAVVFAAQPAFMGKKPLAIAGPPVALLLLALGIATLRSSAVLYDTLLRAAPVLSLGVRLFGGH
jgi:hypothetical protein